MFFFSSRRRHTRFDCDWSSDVCSSDLAPIAERLGLYNMKLELEDLGFKALYPRRYHVLERALRRARGNQKEFLKKIEQQLNAALLKSEIAARVETREKHLHSIYKKMLRKRAIDRKSTRLNSSHSQISYAVFCLKKKKNKQRQNCPN